MCPHTHLHHNIPLLQCVVGVDIINNGLGVWDNMLSVFTHALREVVLFFFSALHRAPTCHLLSWHIISQYIHLYCALHYCRQFWTRWRVVWCELALKKTNKKNNKKIITCTSFHVPVDDLFSQFVRHVLLYEWVLWWCGEYVFCSASIMIYIGFICTHQSKKKNKTISNPLGY